MNLIGKEWYIRNLAYSINNAVTDAHVQPDEIFLFLSFLDCGAKIFLFSWVSTPAPHVSSSLWWQSLSSQWFILYVITVMITLRVYEIQYIPMWYQNVYMRFSVITVMISLCIYEIQKISLCDTESVITVMIRALCSSLCLSSQWQSLVCHHSDDMTD